MRDPIVRGLRRIARAALAGALVAGPGTGATDEDAPLTPIIATEGGPAAQRMGFAVDAAGAYHICWLADANRIYVRSGPFEAFSRPAPLKSLAFSTGEAADPAIAVRTEGAAVAFAARRVASPNDWDIAWAPLFTADPYFLTDDRSGPPVADRRPTLAARRDTVLVAWERGNPAVVQYQLIIANYPYLGFAPLSASAPDAAVDPVAIAGARGAFRVAWTVDTAAGGEIHVAAIGPKGVAGPFPLRRGRGDDRRPCLAVDDAGRVHIVWQEGAAGGRIIYARSVGADGPDAVRFIPPIAASPSGTRAVDPQVAIGADGLPRVCWRNADTGGVEIALMLGDGPSIPTLLVPPANEPRLDMVRPALSRASNGDLLVAFLGPDPATGKSAGWMGFRVTEERGAPAVANFVAQSLAGAVALRWRSEIPEIDRFAIRRSDATGHTVHVATVVAAAADRGEYRYVDSLPAAGTHVYRVAAFDRDGVEIGAAEASVDAAAPSVLAARAAPNPFNGTTAIAIDLPHAGDLAAEVIDIRGVRIAVLATGPRAAGVCRLVWDGRDAAGREVASGVYGIRVRVVDAGGAAAVRTVRVALVR